MLHSFLKRHLTHLTQIAALLLVLSGGLVSQAQVTTGTVRGLVKDQQGAVVPGAQITLADQKNGS